MPYIKNVSYHESISNPNLATENDILIRIADPLFEQKEPATNFHAVHHFEFLDAEDDKIIDADFLISDDDAKALVSILDSALAENRNVIVHCHVGVCRSGAVAEVGVMMGFDDTETYRQPNILVKRKMLEVMGYYDQWK